MILRGLLGFLRNSREDQRVKGGLRSVSGFLGISESGGLRGMSGGLRVVSGAPIRFQGDTTKSQDIPETPRASGALRWSQGGNNTSLGR